MREPPSQSLRLPLLHCGDWECCANWITASRGRATVPDELAVRDDSNLERFVFLLWGPLHFRRLAKDSEIWEELGLR